MKRTVRVALAVLALALMPLIACAQGTVTGTAKTDVYTATANLAVSGGELVGTVVFTEIPHKVCPSAYSVPAGDFWNAWVYVDEGKLIYRTVGPNGDEGPIRADRLEEEIGHLIFGDEGEKVRAFQQKLADIGYYGGEINGVYDIYTVASALMVQSIRYLPKVMNEKQDVELVVPVADDEVIAMINEETGGMLDGVKGPISLTVIGDEVTKLQKALKKLRLYDGDYTGHVGAKTEKAIMKYRIKHGMDDTDFNPAFVPNYVLMAGGQTYENLGGEITDSQKGSCTLQVRFALPENLNGLALHPANTQVTKFDIALK